MEGKREIDRLSAFPKLGRSKPGFDCSRTRILSDRCDLCDCDFCLYDRCDGEVHRLAIVAIIWKPLIAGIVVLRSYGNS